MLQPSGIDPLPWSAERVSYRFDVNRRAAGHVWAVKDANGQRIFFLLSQQTAEFIVTAANAAGDRAGVLERASDETTMARG